MKAYQRRIVSGLFIISSLVPFSSLFASTATSLPYIASPGDQALQINTARSNFAAADIYSANYDKPSKMTVIYGNKTLTEGQYTNNGIKYDYEPVRTNSGVIVGQFVFSYNGNYQAPNVNYVTMQVEDSSGQKSNIAKFAIKMN